MSGGRGDLAAAAKIIILMQRMCPELTFDWIVSDNRHNYDAKAFLSNPSNVNIIKSGERSSHQGEKDKKIF